MILVTLVEIVKVFYVYIEEIMTLQKKKVSTLLHLLAPFLFVRDSVCFTCVWARKSLKYWQSFTISFIPLPPNTPSPGISSIIDQKFIQRNG